MVILEIIKILIQTVWGLLSGILGALLEILPEMLELKRALNTFIPTQTEIVAYCLGVPVVLVSVTVVLIKLAKRLYHT